MSGRQTLRQLISSMKEHPTTVVFHFGRFTLQPEERRLLRAGRLVALEPRAFDLLTALVERGGQLVTKAQLMEIVWPKRVVEEANIHVHVSALRRVLGEEAIETVPGHGYRFTIECERTAGDAPEQPARAKHRLPRPLSSFVGRGDDLAALSRALSQSRLITLTSIGGCGKTRLAIELAETMLPSFPNGAHFVDQGAHARHWLRRSASCPTRVRYTAATSRWRPLRFWRRHVEIGAVRRASRAPQTRP